MSRKSCFLIGHREASEKIHPALYAAIEEHITRYGVTEFMVGRYGSFDSLAAKAVKIAKQSHPEVELTLLLPYHPAERPIPVPDGFDSTYYPPGMENVPRKVAIVRANRYIVDHTDFLIAYAWRPASNARDFLEYARKREGKGFIRVTALPTMIFEKKSLLIYSFHIHKLCIIWHPYQVYRANRSVSLFCNDNLCNILIFRAFISKTRGPFSGVP